jgi:hypothetical protein
MMDEPHTHILLIVELISLVWFALGGPKFGHLILPLEVFGPTSFRTVVRCVEHESDEFGYVYILLASIVYSWADQMSDSIPTHLCI